MVADSYEGIESEVITINDGIIDITSNDDGLNVSSSDETVTTTTTQPGGGGRGGPGGGPGGGDEGVGEHYIYINGGITTITITDALNEQGDGIDANGHVVMTGGVVAVSGPTDTRNSAIDYSGGSFEVTGGMLVGTNVNGRNSEGIEAGSDQASLYLTSSRARPTRSICRGRVPVSWRPASTTRTAPAPWPERRPRPDAQPSGANRRRRRPLCSATAASR